MNNDEEYAAYMESTEPEDREILNDPTGMAYRTIYEKADGYMSKNEFSHIEAQRQELSDREEIENIRDIGPVRDEIAKELDRVCSKN